MRPDGLTAARPGPDGRPGAPARGRGRRPFVSVAIPTCRRPAMLERAVASVAAQTFADWEIVVSDDEAGAGETWALLRGLARRVPGLRAFRNRLAPGQVGNTNNALLRARGTWIKILHDDDRLYPRCLEVLAGLAAKFPDVAAIACAFDRVTPAGRRPYRRGRWAALERLPGAEVVPTMYLLEDLGGSVPTARLVARRVVEAGTLFEERRDLRLAVDTWFNARAAAHGDLLVLREALAEYRAGHESVSTGGSRGEILEELVLLRRHLRGLVPPGRPLPDEGTMADVVRVLHGAARLRRGAPADALPLLARARHPRVAAALARWGLHRLSAGRYSQVRRERLGRDDGLPSGGAP